MGKKLTTTKPCKQGLFPPCEHMKIIPGYWDPRQLRFIEEPEAVDLLELQVVRTLKVSGASEQGDEAEAAAGKSKQS